MYFSKFLQFVSDVLFFSLAELHFLEMMFFGITLAFTSGMTMDLNY